MTPIAKFRRVTEQGRRDEIAWMHRADNADDTMLHAIVVGLTAGRGLSDDRRAELILECVVAWGVRDGDRNAV